MYMKAPAVVLVHLLLSMRKTLAVDVEMLSVVRRFEVGEGHYTRGGALAESFFLSQYWLDACQQSWPPGDTRLARIRLANGELLSALIGCRTVIRHQWLKSRMLALNEYCDPAVDESTIEYNGLYGSDHVNFSAGFDELVRYLLRLEDWDEIRVSGIAHTRAADVIKIGEIHGLRARLFADKPTYLVEFNSLRRDGRTFLSTRSANTRQQLRRARRAIESRFGVVALNQASSLLEAQAWFDESANWHRLRWSTTSKYGGFDNPHFVRFHKKLIALAFADGIIRIHKLIAGGRTLAILYNFFYNNCELFYLGAIDYSVDPECRPGLVAHWLAIESAMANGANAYDFMAGDARYKRSLSTHNDRQQCVILWRPRLRLRLEDWVRQVKHRRFSEPGRAD